MFEPIARLQQSDARRRSSRAWRRSCDQPRLATSAPSALQQPGCARQLHHDARDDEAPGGQSAPHMAHLQYPFLRRRRLGHDALGGSHTRRVFQRPSQSHGRRRRDPVRQRRDDYRRRSVATLSLSSSPAGSGATWTSKTRPVAASCRTRTKEATWSTPCNGLWDWSCCC